MLALKNTLRRILALSLVLLLLPWPFASAAERGVVYPVACRNIFQADTISKTSILEADGSYYMTLQNAVDMLGLKPYGNHYVTPNGMVDVYPETKNLKKITYEGETWYALEQLMTSLNTVILAADGELCYSCVPINQSLLQAETNRIMTDDAYNAFFLEKLPGIGVFTSFAFLFDRLWNQPIETVTGKAYAEDYGALFLEILKHHNDNNCLQRILSEKTEGLNDVVDLVLEAQKYYEKFYELIETPVPGGGYLLFGMEGSGPLHEVLQTNSQFAQMGFDISDILDTTAHLYEIGKIPPMHIDALERILQTAVAKDYSDAVIITQAERTSQIYRDHLEDNRAALVAEGFMMFTEDIAYNIVTDGVLQETPSMVLTKLAIELLDSIPQNPFGNTFEKNSFVKNAALCVRLQSFFRAAFNSSNVSRCDGEAALILRDAAMLYLQTAWVAYDAAGFDRSVAGAVRRMQSLIDDELVLLAGFSDGMFCAQPNEPLPSFSLRDIDGSTESTPSGAVQPEENWMQVYPAYLDFLSTDRYVNDIVNPNIREACEERYISNYFLFRDLDFDGVAELILWLGYTGADGEVLIYTQKGNAVCYIGSAACDGTGTALLCADHDDDFFLECFDGTGAYAERFRIDNGCLLQVAVGEDVPNRWYAVEAVGSLPLAIQKEEADRDPETEMEHDYATLIQQEAFVFFLENGALFDEWMAGTTNFQYWCEDIENDGADELIVWVGNQDQLGEVLVFSMYPEQIRHMGSIACTGGINISGNETATGFLIVGNSNGMEQLTKCDIHNGVLEITEYYMPMETGWVGLTPAFGE